jgi:hypothetical protein
MCVQSRFSLAINFEERGLTHHDESCSLGTQHVPKGYVVVTPENFLIPSFWSVGCPV